MNEIKYEELGFTSDFMFGRIMQDEKICRPFLEEILDVKIDHIEYLEPQKSIDLKVDAKSIRLDIYVDGGDTVYDCEMQTTSNRNLPKRSRYYQGVIDMDLIKKGEDYTRLKKSFVIFICTFDPFGLGRYVYTFEPYCIREDLKLNDGSYKVFINVKGKNDPYISPGLKELFDYIASSRVPGGCKNPLITDMDEALNKARSNEEWRRDFMTLEMLKWDYLEKGREEGLEEGRKEGREEGIVLYNKLVSILLKNKDLDTIEKVTDDAKYCQEMLRKYGLL